MDSVTTAEGLTKLLRAKNTTTAQIYDIVSQFDYLKIYFPHKEVFVVELIQDRWNDQKRDDFKSDYKIWELFNSMWERINDETLLKKLFKNLKFVPLLLKSLQLNQDIETCSLFLKTLLKTISLVNSISTVEVSFENSCKILAQVLNLMNKIKQENTLLSNERNQLITEVITLLDLNSLTEVNYKLSNIYSNDLLLATLGYISKYASDVDEMSIIILKDLLGHFIFSNNVDPLKLLERFFKNNSQSLDIDPAILLFQIAISFLSRSNFKQLEQIFTFVVEAQPKVTPILLNELAASKKTLSQEFLEALFNNALKEATTQVEKYHDPTFWSLLSHILDLDIEIGIKYSETLMTLIRTHKGDEKTATLKIWSNLIACHINAREYVKFISKWQLYCKNLLDTTVDENVCFLYDTDFTKLISDNMVSLSITQLQDMLTEMVDLITGENIIHSDLNKLTLKICLMGLPKLAYNVLTEIKPILARIFEIDTSTDLWEIKYLIMEAYGDIVPEEQLKDLSKENFSQLSNHTGLSANLFYYFFKLREYQEFDFTPIEDKLIELINTCNEKEISPIMLKIFTSWSSIINSLFTKNSIKFLINILLRPEHIDILKSLFINGDFFEEENITFHLVDELANLYTTQKAISYLTEIPIQCINKNARISLINSIGSNIELSTSDISLLCKLLSNPTYKSGLESEFDRLKDFVANQKSGVVVFTKIWSNYISQIKEVSSQRYVNTAINDILSNLFSADVAGVYYKMALEIIKITPDDVITELKERFTKLCLENLATYNKNNEDQLIWLLDATCHMSKVIELDETQVASIHKAISKFKVQEELISNVHLLESLFILYCALFNDSLLYLYPQYLALRKLGVTKHSLFPAVSDVISRVIKTNIVDFNNGFIMTINSFAEDPTCSYTDSILELYELQLTHIEKENSVGAHLFVKSLSSLLTNIHKFSMCRGSIISIIQNIQMLEISKPALFTQFAIETLFALCLKINLLFIKDGSSNNDEVFLHTTKMIANILLVHRVKLSNRNHLVISLLSYLLVFVSKGKEYQLSIESTRSLARLITNFCEPSNVSNNQSNNKHKLSSKVGLIKHSLRKYIPMLLVKYVHLSINHPFEAQDRKELVPAVHSIFTLLSQNELSLVNSILDNSGKQYFKSLYIEYKRSGKWRED